jgi:arylsulfatase A-like enzyme
LVSDGKGPWELYDLSTDGTELQNLIEENPEKASGLQSEFAAWEKRIAAFNSGKTKKKKSPGKGK